MPSNPVTPSYSALASSLVQVGRKSGYFDFKTKRIMTLWFSYQGLIASPTGAVLRKGVKVGIWVHNPNRPWHVYITDASILK